MPFWTLTFIRANRSALFASAPGAEPEFGRLRPGALYGSLGTSNEGVRFHPLAATKNLPSALLHLRHYPSSLDTGDVSELETHMQQMYKGYENRIATIQAELTANRVWFVTETDRFLQSGTRCWTKRVGPSVDPVSTSNGTGKALPKEQRQ